MIESGLVTVLFTDLVGSTELSERIGDAAADQLRRRHFEALRWVISETAGDEVKTIGDAIMVTYRSAADAIAGAVGMQQAVDRQNRHGGSEALAMRVGISAGDATCDDGDWFGRPVIEASRLCAAASGGQILIAEIVKTLAGSRIHHEMTSVGALELKGLPEPLGAAEVRWEPVDEVSVIALPPAFMDRGSDAALDAFVGRDDLLQGLLDRLDKLPDNRVQLVLMSGPAGIGKTRLTIECARRAHHAGVAVLYGRADEDLGLPYQPWVEALGHLVNEVPRLVNSANVAALARLLPTIRAGTSEPPQAPTDRKEDAAETERYLLFGAVADLLAEASRSRPVLLVLDDLHWSEKATLSLLRHLVVAPIGARLLIIGTYRDTDIRRGHPLTDALATLWREPEVERIPLEGLDDAALFEMLETVAGHQVDDDVHDLASALRRETGGNPFFAREILRHLVETGAIYREKERWHANFDLSDAQLPSSVRDVVGQRVARLGDEALRALSVAAVIGREFDLSLLAAISGTDEDDLLDLLEGAVAASVVEELPSQTDRFGFTHALIQRTLYEDLGPARRGRVHRRIAEALESRVDAEQGDHVAELAHHWAAATAPVRVSKAVDYARLAGQRALASLAPDEAVRWYGRALEILGDDSDQAGLRCDLHIDLGIAQQEAGLPEHRQTLLDAAGKAARLHDSDRLVRAALANSRGSESSAGEIDEERVAVLRDALEGLGTVASATRARLLANLVLELTYEPAPTHRRALADEAIDLARTLDDRATLLHCLNAWTSALRLPDTLAERLAKTQEALRLAQGLDHPEREFSAQRQRLQVALESSDRGTVDQATQAMHEIAVRVGQPRLLWVDQQNRALHALLSGDLAGAEALVEAAFELGSKAGQPDALTIYGVQLQEVRVHQGRSAEIVDVLRAAIPDVPGLPALAAAVARGLVDAQRPDEARSLLESSGTDLPYDELWLTGMTIRGFVVSRLGLVDEAEPLYEELSRWSGHHPTAVVAMAESVDHCLGELAAVLGHSEQADQHFEAAEASARSFQAPFFLGRTIIERARLDLATGSSDRGARRLAEARALAARFGYAGLERDAARLGETIH